MAKIPVTQLADENCAAISELQAKLAAAQRTVYRYSPVDDGMTWELWGGDDAATHGNLSGIFPDGPFGGHVNGDSTASGTHPDNTWVDSQLDASGSGQAQVRAKTWVQIPAGGGFLRDNNQNTGERAEIYYGRCGGQYTLIEETTVSTPADDRSILHSNAVAEGWLCIVVLLSDLSANGGLRLQFSVDEIDWSDLNGKQAFPLKIQTQKIGFCDDLPEGWEECELEECVPPTEGGSGDCVPICPAVVAELEGIDGPANLNPDALTQITWVGWQGQDEAFLKTGNSEIEVLGDACSAHITANIVVANLDPGNATGNAQRAAPILWLYRNGAPWSIGASYVRDANGVDQDVLTVNRWDLDPAPGTTYDLRIRRDTIATDPTGQAIGTLEPVTVTNDGVNIENASYMQVAAFRKVAACEIESEPTGPSVEAEPTLSPADGRKVSDNFQDGNGNAPFNLQVRNTTPAPLEWEALISNAPYATIPGLVPGAYTLTSSQNADGTWQHLFSGTSVLNGFASITIDGGLPVPAGSGSNLTLYCAPSQVGQ